MKLECKLIMDVGTQFLRFYREAVELEDNLVAGVLRRYIDESIQSYARIAIRDPVERQGFINWYNRKKGAK